MVTRATLDALRPIVEDYIDRLHERYHLAQVYRDGHMLHVVLDGGATNIGPIRMTAEQWKSMVAHVEGHKGSNVRDMAALQSATAAIREYIADMDARSVPWGMTIEGGLISADIGLAFIRSHPTNGTTLTFAPCSVSSED